MFEVEKQKIKQMVCSDLYDLFKDTKCILAGGAITSLFTSKDVNDLDIYFTSKEGLSQVFANVYAVSEDEYLNEFDMIVKFATERSMLCIDKYNQQKVQLIHYKIHENVQSVFDSFDFEHVMGAFDFATEEFVLHENFLKANAKRSIQFNPSTDFPITSLMRVNKYRERGYSISKAQMLRVAFTIANKQYDSWEKVKSEVSGLYGIAPDDLFDETKPFSLEEVILQLDKVVLNDKYVNTKQPNFEDCVKLMSHNFSDNFNNWLTQNQPKKKHEDGFFSFYEDFYFKCQQDNYDADKIYEVVNLGSVVKGLVNNEADNV